jgi:OmpA-OmpF porin, OOP family
MAMFDNLVSEVEGKFSLGAQTRPLIGEALQLVTGGSGGIAGFLDRFRAAGAGDEISSSMGGTGTAMSVQSVERVVGTGTISGIAGRLGLGTAAVAAALGYVIPRAISLLTPGGKLPASVPAEVTNFLRLIGQFTPNLADAAGPRVAAAATRIREQVPPIAMKVVSDQPHTMRWLWPLLGGLAVLGIGAYIYSSGHNHAPAPVATQTPAPAPAPVATQTPAPAPVATPAPAPPPAVPASTLPAQLALSNDNGVIHYSGSVNDEETRTSIVNALNTAYGADKVQGDIAIDPQRGTAPWLANLRGGLAALNVAGMQAVFDGNAVNLGGTIGDSDRNQIASSLRTVFGSGLTYGSLADNASDWALAANTKAAAALTAQKTGINAPQLIGILNQSVINFPTGSAQVPAASMGVLQDAAAQIKQLPPGTVLEVAGYTDNAGDQAANLALSQQRADAVRNALIQAGVSPSMLEAKGYGSANPASSNDNEAGRVNNRRIEYHLLKS